jgi:hypothetical protein
LLPGVPMHLARQQKREPFEDILPREAALSAIGSAFLFNALFPRGPSALFFALNSSDSILNTTGPALRGLAKRWQ